MINIINWPVALYSWFIPLIIDWNNLGRMVTKCFEPVHEMASSAAAANQFKHQADSSCRQEEFEYEGHEEQGCTEYYPECYCF